MGTSIPNETVICKCLDLLGIGSYRSLFHDHRTKKLTVGRAIQLFVEAQLSKRLSYEEIAENLNASPHLQATLQLDAIRPAQLSRKLPALPTESLQALFLHLVSVLSARTRAMQGLPDAGRLHIVDATVLSLPPTLGQWAYCSSTRNGVKIHTRYVVADPQVMYPDHVVLSTADVNDTEIGVELVTDPDTIHVMDRGYLSYRHFHAWVEGGIPFVVRIKDRSKTTVIRERPVPDGGFLVRDADVTVSYKDGNTVVDVPTRLVEFRDETERIYRLLTNVHDQSAGQISEIYRHRWLIELFFKWIKQHLRLVKLHSTKPQAIWNQIYLALIAYCLVLLVKLETGSPRSPWNILRMIRLYAGSRWDEWLAALFRPPKRTSKGRQAKKKRGRPRKHPRKLVPAHLIVR